MAEANAPPAAAPPPLSDTYATSIDHVQETAKWIIGIVGAIAGLLLAGTQFTKLGELSYRDWRFTVAAISGLFALGIAALIIYSVAQVLVTGSLTLGQLVDAERENPNTPEIRWLIQGDMVAGLDRIADLSERHTALATAYEQAVAANDIATVRALGNRLQYYDRRIARLVLASKFYRTRRAFEEAVGLITTLGVVGAGAIVVFVWCANPPALKPDRYVTPGDAWLLLTPGGKEALASQLGRDCVSAPVRVVVLSFAANAEQKPDVVSVPTDRCSIARLPALDSGVGRLVPTSTIAVATPTPALLR